MNISRENRPCPIRLPCRFQNYSAYCLLAATIFFCLMIGIGSIPGKAEALSTATHDKFLHFSAYFVLGSLIFAGVKGSRLRRTVYTLAAIAVLGGVDETIQYFLPYRKSEWLDWIFNMCAATLSVVVGGATEKVMHARFTAAYSDKQLRQNTKRTN